MKRMRLAAVGMVLAFVLAAPQAHGVAASGGIMTNYFAGGTGYFAHIFMTVGTTSFTVLAGGNVEVLAVGGGGGGGETIGGGGGGGGYLYTNGFGVTAGSYTVIVGGGGRGGWDGAGSYPPGAKGTDSVFGALTAIGGGAGGGYNMNASGTGGSAGGNGAGGGLRAGYTAGQGNDGGVGDGSNAGGGGGGARLAGAAGVSSVGGKGGDGITNSISGVATVYAGGGGGGMRTIFSGGAGGLGGGGNGSNYTGAAGASNTGGGGGGGGYAGGADKAGGDGGSGIVIVRYAFDANLPTIANGAAQNLQTTSADLVGTLLSTGSAPTTVSIYWATNDGGTNAAAWLANGTNANLGPAITGQTFTNTASSLTTGTLYYFNFMANNASGAVWGSSGGSPSFQTAGPPIVNNAGGASAVGFTTAILNGNLTAGLTGHVYILWGPNPASPANTNDLGVRTMGPFSTNLTGLIPDTTYYYACYATNDYGDYLAPFTSFATFGVTWNGAGDKTNWFDPNNWSGGVLPGPTNNVIITNTALVQLTNSVTVGSLTISNATVTFTNWSTALQASNLFIRNAGYLKTVLCGTNGLPSDTNRIYVVCTNLTIDAGGFIDGNLSGFIGRRNGNGYGSGGGLGYSGTQCGGASYGGVGGAGPSTVAAGPTYGSVTLPSQPGSSGGGGSGTGGTGGGAIWIEAAGIVTVNGTIRANGGGAGDQCGGGSGGGIYIRCQAIQGSGTVQAIGGVGSSNGSGAGGGGRIAVDFNAAAQGLLSPKPAFASSAVGGGSTVGWYLAGQLGTISFTDPCILGTVLPHSGEIVIPGFTSWSPGSLTVNNGPVRFTAPAGFTLNVTNDLVCTASGALTLNAASAVTVGGNLVLTNGGALSLYALPTNGTTAYGCALNVAGTIAIASNSYLYPYSQSTNGGSVWITASNVTVALGGQINADSKGFRSGTSTHTSGYGPGYGLKGANSGGGAGYGGVGGRGNHTDSYPGTNYGSATLPLQPGSGGGDYRATLPNNDGNGGGLIWLEVTNQVLCHGTISANGTSPNGYQGAGSGGGIYIRCRMLGSTTTGVIRVNGGNGGSESGGGGGGRIALVNWVTNLFGGTISMNGGIGQGGGATYNGWTGTFYSVSDPSLSLLLRVRGNPTRHDVSTPYDYGSTPMGPGTVVTNSIPLTTEQTATTRYICYGWTLTNDAGVVLGGDGTTQAVFTVNTNVTLVWNWTNQWYLTCSAAANGGLAQDMSGWYTNVVQVTITATSAAPYAFSMWSGAGVPSGQSFVNPLTVTMDSARTIVANFADTSPKTRTWTGVNPWLTASNWSPSGVPGPNDSCIIGSGTCILTDPAAVQSVTVSNGATLLFTNWLTQLSATDVLVLSNGVITHAAIDTIAAPGVSNRVNIACATLTVNAGGSLDANGKGYVAGGATLSGQGPGGGPYYGGGANEGVGGGHGGIGSKSLDSGTIVGSAYDSAYAPIAAGSGGAGGGSLGGGNGGGAIRVAATGRVLVNGVIRANGVAGVSGDRTGGGAGGSVYVTCNTLAGNGQILADGGSGISYGGSGGGGRIAVYYNTGAQPGESPASAVSFSATSRSNTWGGASQPGTIYLPDTQLLPNTIGSVFSNAYRIYGITNWAPASLTVSNCAVYFDEPGFRLTVTNAVQVCGTTPGGAAGLTLTIGGNLSCGSLSAWNGGYANLYRNTNSTESLSVGGDVTLNNGSLTFQYALTNPLSLTIGGNLALTNGSKFTVYAGMTNGATGIPYGGLLDLGGGDLAVPTNCTIYAYSHGTNGGSMKFRCTNLRIDQGGQVNADAAGFANGDSVHQNGYGPGFGYRGANSGGGGGYGGGGQQGNHTGSYPGTTYGSATNPVLPGSGGGDYRATSTTRGCGGGLIWIDVSNRALLNGTLSANGGAPSGYEAAGSGGGIYVRCKRFNGTATGWMQANGGNGGSESGGGGGGRIAVWSQFLDWPFTNNVAVNPGTAVGGYIPVATLGTVYYGQLPIDRGVIFTVQ